MRRGLRQHFMLRPGRMMPGTSRCCLCASCSNGLSPPTAGVRGVAGGPVDRGGASQAQRLAAHAHV